MSKNFARLVFSFTLVFFCAFFLWPILQILKGGFIDADGKLTFAYLGSLLTDPIYLGGLANSFLLALTTTTFALLTRCHWRSCRTGFFSRERGCSARSSLCR